MVVKIKTWDQMKEEFEVNKVLGFINTDIYFTPDMEDELPDDRIIEISKYHDEDTYYDWFSELDKDTGVVGPWAITEDMIEEVIEP